MKYAIIYDSVNGNTKQIANCFYDALVKKECVFINHCEELHENLNCDLTFLGSWCGKGTISDKMEMALPSSCIPLERTYICQGKMPLSVRNRYEQMLENSNTKLQAQHMIQNFNSATFHPDEEDLHIAKTFAIDCYEEVIHGN